MSGALAQAPLLQRYRSFLPLEENLDIISLDEGNTPLVYLKTISIPSRNIEVYAKCEGMNPTGSFKDRGMTFAVTMAASQGARAIICASTGNTSASAAAYAARAGLSAYVVIPDGKIATGKLAQAIMHGARVIQISGNFDTGMAIVKEMSDQGLVTMVNSVNPYRLYGQKTAAFEIVDQLERAPDYHFLPVGNAGNISAYWMGYADYIDNGVISKGPAMIGCQAAGAAPFLRGGPIERPETIATAIQIGRPQSWDLALAAQKESGGWFRESSDQDILKAQKMLAEQEGIFCEPASAVCIAGLIQELNSERISDGATVVCTLTGHGLKDPVCAIEQSEKPIKVSGDLNAVRKIIMEGID